MDAAVIVQTADPSAPNGQAIDTTITAGALVKAKADGTGALVGAVPGTDYQVPLVPGTDYQTPLVPGTDYQVPLPNVGPGAGAIGGTAKAISTFTLDAQGRVTAATAVDAIVPAGVAGGQTIVGGTANTDTLILKSDATATQYIENQNGLTLVRSPAGNALFYVYANADGAAIQAALNCWVGGAQLAALTAYAPSFTSSGARKASGAVVDAPGVGGLSLVAARELREYTGGGADANLRRTVSPTGAWTVPLAGSKIVQGSAVQTMTLSGLDGDTAESYRLTIFVINPTASDVTLYLRPNGASTNLHSMLSVTNEAGTEAILADTSWWVQSLRASSEALITVTVRCKSGNRRYATWQSVSCRDADSLALTMKGAGVWVETPTNLTSFDVYSDTAGTIGIGSSIKAEVVGFMLG